MSSKVLLIFPSSLFIPRSALVFNFHLHLLVLYSFLKQHGIAVDVLDLEQELEQDESPSKLDNFRAQVRVLLAQYTLDIVAISCYSSYEYLSSVIVAEVCKELNKQCTIVVGGYHPTAVSEDFTSREDLFDYVIRGEGEDALLDICAGRYPKNETSRVIEGTPRDLTKGVDLDWAGYKYVHSGMRQIGINFSRGCPGICTYCSESVVPYRRRDYAVDIALQEIKKAIDVVDPQILYFYDPLFPVYTPWGEELLERLVREKIDTPLWLMTRIDMITKKQIELFSKLNVRILLGLESCSKKMLTIMHKTKDPDTYLKKAEENLGYISEYDVFCDLGFIFNHPGETPETIEETITFIERILARQHKISFSLYYTLDFRYLPGTYISDNLSYFKKEFGTVIRHQEWWKKHGNQVVLAQDNVPSRELPQKAKWQSRVDSLIERHMKEKVSRKTLLFEAWFEKIAQ